MNINMGQLALFESVALEGSVTRGAERSAVTQPAVSKSIAELERALGVSLLDRGPRGVRLTEAGEVLHQYAVRIFRLEAEAIEALGELRGLQAGSLSVGASTTIGDHLLPKPLAEFCQRHPGIEVEVEIGNTEAVQKGVEDGRYDVGFTEGEADPARFVTSVFAEDELIVVASPAHRLAGQRAVTLADLAGEPFVMREPGSGTRYVIERHFAQRGFSPRIAASVGSATAIKRAVEAGLGIAVLSKLAASDEISSGRLVRLHVDLEISRPLHRISLKWRRPSAALRSFLDELRLSIQLL